MSETGGGWLESLTAEERRSAEEMMAVATELGLDDPEGLARWDVRMGRPIESPDGRRAAVEFWVRMLNSGAEVTLVGILFLRFAEDGRCEELRETWFFETGDHAPHEGWGA